MHLKLKWIISLLFIVGVSILYLWPVPRVPFDELYMKVDPAIVNSLRSFRQANPLQQLQIDSTIWEYISIGSGQEVILFCMV